jgi:hypothetical protein
LQGWGTQSRRGYISGEGLKAGLEAAAFAWRQFLDELVERGDIAPWKRLEAHGIR